MNKGIISPIPIRRKTPIFSLNDIVYEQQPNSAFNFNYSMLNLPQKRFTRPPRYRFKKKRTLKTPISPIPEASDEDSKGGKKKKRRKRYTRKRKN